MSSDSSHKGIIALEAFHTLSISLDTVEDFVAPGDGAIAHRIQVAFTPEVHAQELRRFRLTMLVNLTPESDESKDLPYKLASRSAGYFLAPFDLESDSLDASMIGNALSIMYGALRGIVLQTTAAAAYGPVLLPTVDMADVVRHRARVIGGSPASPEKKPRRTSRKSGPKRKP